MGLLVNPRGRPPRQLEWTAGNDVPVLVSGDGTSPGRVLAGDNLVRVADDGPGTTIRVGLDPAEALVGGFITYEGGPSPVWAPLPEFLLSGDLPGVFEGTPADMSFAMFAGPSLLIDPLPSGAYEPFEFKLGRKYHNLTRVGRVRVQGAVVQSVADATVALQGSTDSGVSWDFLDLADGPFFSAAAIRYPAAGAWVTPDDSLRTNNVLLRLVTTGGDGASVLEVGTVYVDTVSALSPPTTAYPGTPSLPGEPDWGAVILDLNARSVEGLADGARVTTWVDDSASGNDGYTAGAFGGGEYQSTGFAGLDAPYVASKAADYGWVSPTTYPNNETLYFLLSDVTGPGRVFEFPGGNAENGFLNVQADGTLYGGLIWSFFGTPRGSGTAVVDDGAPHIIRVVHNRSGSFKVYVDGILDISVTDALFVNGWFGANIYFGAASTDTDRLPAFYHRIVRYSAAHTTAGLNLPEEAILAGAGVTL
jgi:hypothetical protein